AKAAALDTFPERRAELRDEAIACMPLVDLRVAKQWHGHPPATRGRAIDRQLGRYVRCDSGGTVSVRRLADDAELFRFPVKNPPSMALASARTAGISRSALRLNFRLTTCGSGTWTWARLWRAVHRWSRPTRSIPMDANWRPHRPMGR